MSRTTIVLGVAALGLAGASVFVWNQLQADRAHARGQLIRIAELEHDAPVPAVAPSASPAAPTEPALPETRVSSTPLPAVQGSDERALLRDPAYRAAAIERRKLFTRGSAKDLRDWVTMTDETFEDYLDLEAEHSAELEELMPRTPEEMKSAALDQRREQAIQRQHQEMERLFGPGRYQQYREWVQATIPRMRIRSLNGQLSGADVITEQNIKAAALAMSKAEQKTRNDSLAEWGMTGASSAAGRRDPADRARAQDHMLELIRRQNESMRAAAAPYLSSKQIKLLDDIFKADVDNMEASVRLQRAKPGG